MTCLSCIVSVILKNIFSIDNQSDTSAVIYNQSISRQVLGRGLNNMKYEVKI